MKVAQSLLLLSLAAGARCFAAGAYVFPSIDEDQRWEPPDEQSFGTLIEDLFTPGDARRARPVDLGPLRSEPDFDELLARYDALLDGGYFTQAVTVAEAMVATARRDYGEDDIQYGYALSDLAAAYHHDGRFRAALAPMRSSISILRRRLGVMHPDLIGPYAYLGMSLQALGEHRKALDSLSRAQGLTHRHLGAKNLDQLKLLHAKADSFEALGRLWEAEQLLRTALKLEREHHGADDPRTLPALLNLAGWLRDHARYNDALSLYRDSLQALADDTGGDTPVMAGVMREMALTYLFRGDHETDRGLRLQHRIVQLTERYPNSFALPERIRAQLDLGDWLTLFGRHRQARGHYAQAWRLSRNDDSGKDWDELFAQPHLIFAGPNIPLDSLGYRFANEFAYADFRFDIRANGQPARVRLTGTNIHATNITEAIGLIRFARFRPPLPGGEPQPVSAYRMRRIYNTEPPPDYGVVSLGGVAPLQ